MTIYTPHGTRISRKIGFSDNPLVEERDDEFDYLVDACGIEYWPDSEEYVSELSETANETQKKGE